MPDQLRSAGPAVRRATLLVLAWAVWGALLGLLWVTLWEPPQGTAFEGEWFPSREGLGQDVSATALFALLGIAGGLVLGAVSAFLTRTAEVVTLVATCVGSVLAAWVMFQVGHALGPPDPQVVAAGAAEMAEVPGDLRLAGAGTRPWPFWFESSAFCAMPGGALLALVGVFLSGRRPAT